MSDKKLRSSSKKRGIASLSSDQGVALLACETKITKQAPERASMNGKQAMDLADSKPAVCGDHDYSDGTDDNDSKSVAQDDVKVLTSNRKRIWLKLKPHMSKDDRKKEKREANRLSAYHSRKRKHDIINNLKGTVAEIDKDTEKLKVEHQQLQSNLTFLKADNLQLKSENGALRNELARLPASNPWVQSLSNATTNPQTETSHDIAEPPQSRHTIDTVQVAASFGQQPAGSRVEPSQQQFISPGDQWRSLEMEAQLLGDNVPAINARRNKTQSVLTQQNVVGYSRRGSIGTTRDTSTILREEGMQLQQLLMYQQQQQLQEAQFQQAFAHLTPVQSSIPSLPGSTTARTLPSGTATGTNPPSVPPQYLASGLTEQQNLSPGESAWMPQIMRMANQQGGNPNQ